MADKRYRYSGPPEERPLWADLLEGGAPPWVMRFVKGVGRTVNNYSMIGPGDKVLIGVSGGKDSLALALALSLRRRWLPITYELKALLINWVEQPISPEDLERIRVFFDALEIELEVASEPIRPESFKGVFNCYLCSRNRRRILFTAADRDGIGTVALGHHLDDLVETAMINLFFRGRFETMRPVQPFFDGKIRLIRPMIEQKEAAAARLASAWGLPVAAKVCPEDQNNIRARLKPLVGQLARIDRLAREHVFEACGFEPGGKVGS